MVCFPGLSGGGLGVEGFMVGNIVGGAGKEEIASLVEEVVDVVEVDFACFFARGGMVATLGS